MERDSHDHERRGCRHRDKITAVGSSASVVIPSGAKVIDLGDATLLPGFIDAHTHVIGRVLGDPSSDISVVRDFPSFEAILGVRNAERTLLAGFTSIRNVGASNFDDFAIAQSHTLRLGDGTADAGVGHALGSGATVTKRFQARPIRRFDKTARGRPTMYRSVRISQYGADV